MFEFLRKPPPAAAVPPATADGPPEQPRGLFGRLRARLNRGDSLLTRDIVELLPGAEQGDCET